MERIEGSLKKLNFNEKEIKIYIVTLELETASVSTIAKEVNLQREETYLILKGLEEKGYAFHIHNISEKYYSVIDPEEIIKFF
jgi:sugar-specific transcriptional regulator TrmB